MLFPVSSLNSQMFLAFIRKNSYEWKKFTQFSDSESKYFDIDELQQLEISNKEKSLSLFDINSWSKKKNFQEPQNLLQSTNINFYLIAITETRIPKMFF